MNSATVSEASTVRGTKQNIAHCGRRPCQLAGGCVHSHHNGSLTDSRSRRLELPTFFLQQRTHCVNSKRKKKHLFQPTYVRTRPSILRTCVGTCTPSQTHPRSPIGVGLLCFVRSFPCFYPPLLQSIPSYPHLPRASFMILKGNVRTYVKT